MHQMYAPNLRYISKLDDSASFIVNVGVIHIWDSLKIVQSHKWHWANVCLGAEPLAYDTPNNAPIPWQNTDFGNKIANVLIASRVISYFLHKAWQMFFQTINIKIQTFQIVSVVKSISTVSSTKQNEKKCQYELPLEMAADTFDINMNSTLISLHKQRTFVCKRSDHLSLSAAVWTAFGYFALHSKVSPNSACVCVCVWLAGSVYRCAQWTVVLRKRITTIW